jgi:hypothetical protein
MQRHEAGRLIEAEGNLEGQLLGVGSKDRGGGQVFEPAFRQGLGLTEQGHHQTVFIVEQLEGGDRWHPLVGRF